MSPQALMDALSIDEHTFVTLIDTLEPAQRRGVFGGRSGARRFGQMQQRAIALDRPFALERLRRLGEDPEGAHLRPQLLAGPDVANQAVRAGSRALASQAVERRELDAAAFAAAFGATEGDSQLRVIAGEMSPAAYFDLFPGDQGTALQWVVDGRLPYAEAVAVLGFQMGDAWAHVNAGIVTAEVALRTFASQPGSRDLAERFVDAELLESEQLLAAAADAPWLHDFLLRSYEQDLLSLEEWMIWGKPPEKLLLEAVLQDEVPVTRAFQCLRFSDASIERLIDANKLDGLSSKDIVGITSQNYTSDSKLSAYEIVHTRTYGSIPALLEALSPLPLGANRQSYTARMMAAFVQGPTGTSADELPPSAQPCVVCSEDSCGHLSKPAACSHPASFGLDCLQKAIIAAETDQCPYPNCTTPLTPNDLIDLGLGGARADQLAQRIVSRHLAGGAVRGWRPCPTAGCLGGNVATSMDIRQFHCSVCQKEVEVRDTYQLDLRVDRQKIKRLISDLAGRPILPRSVKEGGMKGKIRECYHCGSPNQHDGFCSHMACRRCERSYDFIQGDMRHEGRCISSSQTYVPKDGLLLHAGLYKGLTPGATYDALYLRTRVRLNALKLGIWFTW